MEQSRRKLLKTIVGVCAFHPACSLLAGPNSVNQQRWADSNFRFIYLNSPHKKDFYRFLVNVFHLFPEQEFHRLISEVTNKPLSDQQIYTQVQQQLDDISSLLAPFRYAIPALNKQKKMIAQQTLQLLGEQRDFNGYLEIGSTGRYLDELEEHLEISGPRFFVSEKPATYAPTDMVDRGQMFKAGDDIGLNNYQPSMSVIARDSLDLVTVFIGFHHCPLSLRSSFIRSIKEVMRKGACLVVRDHNVNNKKMKHMVGLAHDVFNLGTQESWAYNQAELRHFYSLAQLDKLLQQHGFKSDGTRLYQQGDPTKNALMIYRKV